jgi:hypothetical protein
VAPSGDITATAPEFEVALTMARLTEAELRRERIASPLLRDESLCVTLRELGRIDQERSR